MTDKPEQNITSNKDFSSEKNNSKKKCPSLESYLIKNNPIYFQQYPLFDCGFLRGRDSKIRFIRNQMSHEFKISPTVNKCFIEGNLSDQIETLKDWDRLYIEVFGQRYIVKWSQDKDDEILIYSKDTGTKTPITLRVGDYFSKEINSFTDCYSLGESSCISITGKDITVNLSEDDSSLRDSLYWQIPIFYIMEDLVVKSSESVIEKVIALNKEKKWIIHFYNKIRNSIIKIRSNSTKLYVSIYKKIKSILKQIFSFKNAIKWIMRFISNIYSFIKEILGISSKTDELYRDFIELKLKYSRSNPIGQTESSIAGKICDILNQHYMIEERFEKCCSLVDFYLKSQNELKIRKMNRYVFIITFVGLVCVLNDGWELVNKFRDTEVVNAIATYFIPCSL
ncbi:hypothetical protein [Succinivibrio dextrinosolvens]|uniref:hypothetical protein n=1 Tax=Succinivibrio dextrinosolvens TaxID=83771 RepID=UPI0004E24B83|nr:hypothetical protein [Succinivibrio dextrinosolvens]